MCFFAALELLVNRAKITASLASLILPTVAALSGCSTTYAPSAVETEIAETNAAGMGGSLYGGRQAITGAHIYMYAADTTAYGHASDSLLLSYTSGSYPSTEDSNGNYYVTTNGDGAFYLSAGEYSCAPGQQVYMYSVGGNAGGGTNSAAGLMAVLGQCLSGGAFAGISEVNLNEVSTVAAAYALSGYAVDATHIANAATNAAHVSAGTTTLANTAMANAFASAALLYNVSTSGFGVGRTTTPNGNGTVPQSEIHTLANILANCINSTGPTSPACSNLFSDAESAGSTGTEPTDTASAAINIAHYPTNNVTKIFNLSSSTVVPYSPNLGSTAPNDFSISINYTVTGINYPGAIAIDGSGNIWIPNIAGNSLSKISPLGVPATGQPFTGSLNNPYSVAADASGNAWVTSRYTESVVEFNSSGTVVNTYKGNGSLSPMGVALDASGNMWVANNGGTTVSELSLSTGKEATGSPFSLSSASQPASVTIDTSGYIWVANAGADDIEQLSSSGANAGKSPYTGGGDGGWLLSAVDSSGSVWVPNTSGNTITKMTKDGASGNYKTTSISGGMNQPYQVALDGAGNAWVTNEGSGTFVEFSNAGTQLSPTSGYSSNINGPFSIAVDGAGNVWIANGGSEKIVEYVGLAIPVVTPLVTALTNKTLASEP